MQKKTDTKTYERIVVDHRSGEVVEEEFIHKRAAEPPFVKLYLDCLCDFKGLSKSLNPILVELLKCMSYASSEDRTGGQIIYLNAALKRQIAVNTGKTVKRVEQALTDFVKAGIFRRIAIGTYQVNAELFGKGDWKDIKNIRATFDYRAGTVDADIIKGEESENCPSGSNISIVSA